MKELDYIMKKWYVYLVLKDESRKEIAALSSESAAKNYAALFVSKTIVSFS